MRPQADIVLERPIRSLGLLAAAAAAWALLVPLPFLAEVADNMFWAPAWMRGTSATPFGMIFVIVIFMAIFGLPLSLLFCFGLGYPAWLVASRLGCKRRRNAVWLGIILGLALDLVLAALKYRGVILVEQHREPLTKFIVFYPAIAFYVAAVGAAAGWAAWWAAGAKYVRHSEAMARVFT